MYNIIIIQSYETVEFINENDTDITVYFPFGQVSKQATEQTIPEGSAETTCKIIREFIKRDFK
jgi:hypothetical protein